MDVQDQATQADLLAPLDREMTDQFTDVQNQPDLAQRFFRALGAGKK